MHWPTGFIFLCSLACCAALYAGSKVTLLSSKTFNDKVHNNERATLVQFFSPNCGHCQRLRPAYGALAEDLHGLLDVAAIDCTVAANNGVCARHQVKGYPTVKLFIFSGKGIHKKPIDYNGDRTKKDMVAFVKRHMHSFIFKISPAAADSKHKWSVTFEKFMAKSVKLPKFITVQPSTDPQPKLLLRALSIAYHYKVIFGQVKFSDAPDSLKALNLPADSASVVMFPAGSETPVKFTGPLKRSALAAFIDDQLRVLPASKTVELRAWDALNSACLRQSEYSWCVISLYNAATEGVVAAGIETAIRKEDLAKEVVFLKARDFAEASHLFKSLGLVEEYPSVLLIAPRKGQYAVMTKEFSEKSFVDFLSAATKGNSRFANYDNDLFFKADAAADYKIEL